jgi:hypothetical protein
VMPFPSFYWRLAAADLKGGHLCGPWLAIGRNHQGIINVRVGIGLAL